MNEKTKTKQRKTEKASANFKPAGTAINAA